MRWIENITLRSTKPIQRKEAAEFTKQLERLPENKDFKEIRVYRNSLLDNEWSVHIHWDTNVFKEKKSPLGLQIADAFKEFGMVHHSIWSEKMTR